jgi:hypothetical protein
VIHVRLGNMDMRSFHEAIAKCWEEVLRTSATHKLVIVHAARIESVQ